MSGLGVRCRVEVVAPDEPGTFVRVLLDGSWVGDLLPRTRADRDVLLAALADGRLDVQCRPVPLLDVSVAERADRPV